MAQGVVRAERPLGEQRLFRPDVQRRALEFAKGLDVTQARTLEGARRAFDTFETGFGGQQLRSYSIAVKPSDRTAPAKKDVGSGKEAPQDEKQERWFAAGFWPM